MEVFAITKNIPMSAQKMREVVRQIQGLPVVKAQAVLAVVSRKSARYVAKTLNSAKANAEDLKEHKAEYEFFVRLSRRSESLRDFLSGKNNGSFLRQLFDCDNCSSGSPVYEISGWITELVCVQSREKLLLKDSSHNCAIVKFAQDHTHKKLACLAGIFNSRYDTHTNTLTPLFDRMWVEYNPRPEDGKSEDHFFGNDD